MTTQKDSGSFQSLGNGVYRVTGVLRRSAATGRYITESPRQTSKVSEPPRQPANTRAKISK